MIAENLKRLRLARDWSQSRLARVSGIDVKQISNFECGERAPNIANLIKLKKALDCSYDDLLTETRTKPTKPKHKTK